MACKRALGSGGMAEIIFPERKFQPPTRKPLLGQNKTWPPFRCKRPTCRPVYSFGEGLPRTSRRSSAGQRVDAVVDGAQDGCAVGCAQLALDLHTQGWLQLGNFQADSLVVEREVGARNFQRVFGVMVGPVILGACEIPDFKVVIQS